MPKKLTRAGIEAWTLDQLAKSAFFHRKLHDWKLIEIANQIDGVRGENLAWDRLNISDQAWNKIIHSGVKPVVIFAHPDVLRTVPGSTAYYRMLAMVSQKSMKRVGINLDLYETGAVSPDEETVLAVVHHLNRIISALIETDEKVDAREFDLWRGMAAGAQAQGSWQNSKGASAEAAIRAVILQRLQETAIITPEQTNAAKIDLGGSRVLVFADEPDIAIYLDEKLEIAVEIKGGIDPAGVLERLGAALKSLQRARRENAKAVTILILQDVSMTERALQDVNLSADMVTHLFSIKAIVENVDEQEEFFRILNV